MKKLFSQFFFPQVQPQSLAFEIAYTCFRFYCGISICIGAGLPKLFHKIDENGSTEWSNLTFGTSQWFIDQVQNIGFTFISPQFWAALAVYGEFIGGLLIALGLFTRLSSIQMAFQFFVVAFLWYDEPMPFAMYYQQLIFWSFALIAVVGSGRFSLDFLFQKRKTQSGQLPSRTSGKMALLVSLLMASFSLSAQEHIPFVLKNSSAKSVSVKVSYYNHATSAISGYGLDLSPFGSEAVNMPVGTRVYLLNRDKEQLLVVIKPENQGEKIDVTKDYAISRQEWLDESYASMNEKTARLRSANPTVESFAQNRGLDLIPMRFVGKGLIGRQVYLRYELPEEKPDQNLGFSKWMSRFSETYLALPVGTKVFLCDGPYWEGNAFAEKLLLVVDGEKSNYTFKI